MIRYINPLKCNGCGICTEICTMDVIRLGKRQKKADADDLLAQNNSSADSDEIAYITYPEDCMTCFNCELNCPEHAIDVDFVRLIVPAI